MTTSPDQSPNQRLEDIKSRSKILNVLLKDIIARHPGVWPYLLNDTVDTIEADIGVMRHLSPEQLTEKITSLRDEAVGQHVFSPNFDPVFTHVLTEALFCAGHELREHADDIKYISPLLVERFNNKLSLLEDPESSVEGMKMILQSGAASTTTIHGDPTAPKVQ